MQDRVLDLRAGWPALDGLGVTAFALTGGGALTGCTSGRMVSVSWLIIFAFFGSHRMAKVLDLD